jgi:succinate dehydrogenase / fumarate reductase cytochrome b subunit
MTNTRPAERPLSPHLQVYRPQMTSMTSITHRATGFGLAAGAVAATWWLLAAMAGSPAYDSFYLFAKSLPGQFMLFGWLWAFCYHLLNGIRHLVWDTGHGIEIPFANKSGWAVIIGSVLLTALLWRMA